MGDADLETKRFVARSILHRINELAPQGEDLLCVSKDCAARFGEREPPAVALEKFLAEGRLESLELSANRGLSEA